MCWISLWQWPYPKQVSKFKNVQKRALSIICPSLSYDQVLRKLVFQPLFHIARTYVTRLLMLPSATRITNLTSYLTEANIKASYLLTNHQQSRRQTVLRTLLFCHRAYSTIKWFGFNAFIYYMHEFWILIYCKLFYFSLVLYFVNVQFSLWLLMYLF